MHPHAVEERSIDARIAQQALRNRRWDRLVVRTTRVDVALPIIEGICGRLRFSFVLVVVRAPGVRYRIGI